MSLGKILFSIQVLSFYLFAILLGQAKKNGDKTANEDTESKEGQTAEPTAGLEPVPNSTAMSGSLGTNVSRGPLNSQQPMKRSASGDPVTKQPPGKKKKV